MSDYLESKGVEKATFIVGFEVVQIEFDWQLYDDNDLESGCFLLMNMACYDGDVYESDLRSKINRRTYVAQISAALILADINEYRTRVLERVEKFVSKRTTLWNFLKNKRHYQRKEKQIKTKSVAEVIEGLKKKPLKSALPTEDVDKKDDTEEQAEKDKIDDENGSQIEVSVLATEPLMTIRPQGGNSSRSAYFNTLEQKFAL